ncbi:serine hydrolase domain-containing protein [Maribellus sediminis]|uniref:serine hydrolase domain-containing protein n=1 Tax=Maribellus sediminis TaxID=2696285 RepID=UPI0014312359|nr:serine hydrolase domain-containing protein [Maribellus sediminis]
MKKILVLLLVLLVCVSGAFAQISEEERASINSLFSEWDTDHTPGAAYAIVKDGVLAANGFGMANLEYDVPITANTVFHIASESKQYVDYCIVLLAQEGKLSLDDDIRKYLPWVPDFGETITINHLIHHTSGLRDQWQLLAISGTRIDDVIKQDQILNLVKNQKRLNFSPGEKHLYCNTGYTLLGEIVKEVSGVSLREYCDSVIFKPLGMTNTHFHDNYKEVVKNRAYSYSQKDSVTYENAILSYSTIGATSLFTTVMDEALWLMNYNSPVVGNKATVEQMMERGILNSGDTLNYAFGLSIEKYKGFNRIGHGGADAGYRTYTCRFPEENLGIVVFSNLGTFNPVIVAQKIADILLGIAETKEEPEAKTNPAESPVLNVENYRANLGHYKNDGIGVRFELKEDQQSILLLMSGEEPQKLNIIENNRFNVFGGTVTLDILDVNSINATLGGGTYKFVKYEPYSSDISELRSYEGKFFNDETETYYSIVMEDNALILDHLKYGKVELIPVNENQFASPHWWMGKIDFIRNEQNEITGFEINDGRVHHLVFEKQ